VPKRYIWPHQEYTKQTGEKLRILRGQEVGEEIAISLPLPPRSYRRSCVYLKIGGFELFIGTCDVSPDHVSKPGFILYKGVPDALTRKRIRYCLSFCLGSYLVYLGNTNFDASWKPVSFVAESAYVPA